MLLIQLIMDARLVVLPEPVGPVTRIKPRGRVINCSDHRRQPELLEREELVGNSPQHQPDVAALLVDRHAEPGHVAEREAEVRPPTSCSSCWHRSGVMLFIRDDRVRRLEHLGRQRTHVTVQPQHGLAAHGEVQVARLLGADRLEQFVDEQRTHCPGSPSAERRWNLSRPTQGRPLPAVDFFL